jgi:hypothetical protein
MTAPLSAAAAVLGRKVWLTHTPHRLLGEIAGPVHEDQVLVRWFIGPGRSATATVALSHVEPAALSSQQRIYIAPGDYWRFGRVVCDVPGDRALAPLRTFAIALPAGERVPLPENEFHVHCDALVPDPFDGLLARATDTPFLFEHRHKFIAALTTQHAIGGGQTGLLAARIELYAHQVLAARRMLTSTQPRFILADAVGLGKTITAGIVLNQRFFDDEETSVTVLAPASQVPLWQKELFAHFELEPDDDGGLQLQSFDAIDTLAVPNLLIVDEVEQILQGPLGRQEKLGKLLAAAPRVLLLARPETLAHAGQRQTLLGWLGADVDAERQIIRNYRQQLPAMLTQRPAPRDEGELDPEARQAIWTAFEAWRQLVVASPASERLVPVFRVLLEAVASWGGFASKLVRARLGGDKTGPDADKLSLAASVPVQPGEEAALRALATALENDAATDRIALLIGLLKQDGKRLPRVPKTLICASTAAAATEIAERLRKQLLLRAALLVRGLPAVALSEAVEQFRTEAGCSVLVIDDASLAGVGVGFAERLVHLDLPLDPFVLERRIGRVDRLGRVAAKLPQVVVRAQLDTPSWDDAWFTLLHTGLNVFTQSIADVAEWAGRRMNDLVAAGYRTGQTAWQVSLAEELTAARAAARPGIDYGLFPAKAADQFFARLRDYEAEAQPFQDAVFGYLKLVNNIDVPKLQAADVTTQIRFHSHANVLLPEKWYQEIAPELSKPFVFDRTEGQRDLDKQFLRLGQPLVDQLHAFARRDDRGQAYALWRRVAGAGKLQLFVRLVVRTSANQPALQAALAEVPTLAHFGPELLRLAESFYSARIDSVFLDEAGQIVTESARIESLAKPYDKRKDDWNLSKERVKVIDETIGAARWEQTIRTARERLAEAVRAYAPLAKARTAALKAATEYGQALNVPDAVGIRAALTAALEMPTIELDAAGVIALAGTPCPITVEERR